jgi:hypothetical protein
MASDAGDLAHLDEDVQKVEFKVTAVPEDEDKVKALVAGEGTERAVYFYDTKPLDLHAQHIVLRARVTAGEGDSTVKLRPAVIDDKDARWREIEKKKRRVELDVVGVKQVPSVKVDRKPDGTPTAGEIADVAKRGDGVDSLFSDTQEQLIEAYAPDGISLVDVKVLGPVEARVWDDLQLDGFEPKVSVEEWKLPDGPHFYELSFKVDPDEASAANDGFRAVLEKLGITNPDEQVPKTEQVLEFFAARLP